MQINSISESMVKYSQKMLKKHPNAPYVIYQASLIFFFKVWAPLVLWLVLLPADVTSCKGNVFEFCGSTYVQGTLKGVLGLNTTTLTLEDAFKEPSQYYPDLYPVPICEHNYSVIVWQRALIDNKHATYSSTELMNGRLICKGRKLYFQIAKNLMGAFAKVKIGLKKTFCQKSNFFSLIKWNF